MSAFKQLYTDMINNGGNSTMPRKAVCCYVKQAFPHFLVTDGYCYVACYFSKGAVDEFHSKFKGSNITDMRGKVINITDYSLEMNRVNSSNVFTSYGGIEVRLIVKSFKPVAGDKKTPTLTRHPENLFRDYEIKMAVQKYTHACLAKAVGGAKESCPDISKFSGKSNVSQGVSSFGGNVFTFKDGKSAFVDMNSIFKGEKGADALKKRSGGSKSPVKKTLKDLKKKLSKKGSKKK